MSSERQNQGRKIVASSDLYTIILALAFCVVLATAVFVTCKCYFQYGTIFKIP